MTPDTPPAPEKGVADILVDAFKLYRANAKPLLTICAVLFVPAAVINSMALAAIVSPTLAIAGAPDPAAALAGSLSVHLLGLLGMAVTAFFLYGIIVPLTNGALTIAAADRILGGQAGWREVWMLLFRRLGKLLSAVVPAAIIVVIGCFFFLVPGLILALLFTLVSPVVLVEGLSGRAALERSTTLVRSDWLRVALLLLAFAVVRWVAQLVASIFVAPTAIFLGSLLGDLITMVMLPVPVLGTVLLYFDIRRKRDGRREREARPDVHSA
jgi:hypothetical protein